MEREALDPETDETMTVPADMTYKEWYEKYVDNMKYMANSFRPKYESAKNISYSTKNDKIVNVEVKRDFIRHNLSRYANDGWLSGNFSEIVAESFSIKNPTAKNILDLLR